MYAKPIFLALYSFHHYYHCKTKPSVHSNTFESSWIVETAHLEITGKQLQTCLANKFYIKDIIIWQ